MFRAAPGTLEHFLVERYPLFTRRGERVYLAPMWHAPWALFTFEVEDVPGVYPGGGAEVATAENVGQFAADKGVVFAGIVAPYEGLDAQFQG